MLKTISIMAYLLMALGVVGLIFAGSLFSVSAFTIAAQIAAALLMIWARATLGRRSFHAAANPTEGGLITTGPYRYIRHPIYTSVCLFCLAGILANLSVIAAILGLIVFAGALSRMLAEEKLLVDRYPDYRLYAGKTKRMVPFVF